MIFSGNDANTLPPNKGSKVTSISMHIHSAHELLRGSTAVSTSLSCFLLPVEADGCQFLILVLLRVSACSRHCCKVFTVESVGSVSCVTSAAAAESRTKTQQQTQIAHNVIGNSVNATHQPTNCVKKSEFLSRFNEKFNSNKDGSLYHT